MDYPLRRFNPYYRKKKKKPKTDSGKNAGKKTLKRIFKNIDAGKKSEKEESK